LHCNSKPGREVVDFFTGHTLIQCRLRGRCTAIFCVDEGLALNCGTNHFKFFVRMEQYGTAEESDTYRVCVVGGYAGFESGNIVLPKHQVPFTVCRVTCKRQSSTDHVFTPLVRLKRNEVSTAFLSLGERLHFSLVNSCYVHLHCIPRESFICRFALQLLARASPFRPS
jgi:hypothetical protein